MKNLEMDVCVLNIIYFEVVNKVKESLLSDDFIFNLVDFFKIFSDLICIKIICVLMEIELCVCDLVNVINIF